MDEDEKQEIINENFGKLPKYKKQFRIVAYGITENRNSISVSIFNQSKGAFRAFGRAGRPRPIIIIITTMIITITIGARGA